MALWVRCMQRICRERPFPTMEINLILNKYGYIDGFVRIKDLMTNILT